jgi:hypothetical protein
LKKPPKPIVEVLPKGLIHSWGSKKRKKDSKTFVGLLFANNIYLKKFE